MIEPFFVTTPLGDAVVARNIFINFPILFLNRVTLVDLVEIYMVDFDVIFRVDWLHACLSLIDCSIRVVKFKFLNEPVLKFNGGKSINRGPITSCVKACKIMSKGFLYHIVRVKDLESQFLNSNRSP